MFNILFDMMQWYFVSSFLHLAISKLCFVFYKRFITTIDNEVRNLKFSWMVWCAETEYTLSVLIHTYKYLLNYQNKNFCISACTLIIFPFNFRTGGHFIIAELDFLVNKLFSFQGQGSFFVEGCCTKVSQTRQFCRLEWLSLSKFLYT